MSYYRSLRVLLVLVMCWSVPACVDAEEWPAFTNADIEWKGSSFGLGWKLIGKAKEAAHQDNKGKIDQLMILLSDKDRFAVAHILLASMYGLKSEKLPNRIDDNPKDDTVFLSGLRVTFGTDGTPTYDERDRKLLVEYWRRELKLAEQPGKK